jgi:hypothetical protein
MELRVPEIDLKDYVLGNKLGTGLDKVAYKVHWAATGEELPLVLKHQHGCHYREPGQSQTEIELRFYNGLLEQVKLPSARLMLSHLCAIVGYAYEGEDLWLLQEYAPSQPKYDPTVWETPIGCLADQGGSNIGVGVNGQPVSRDYGLCRNENDIDSALEFCDQYLVKLELAGGDLATCRKLHALDKQIEDLHQRELRWTLDDWRCNQDDEDDDWYADQIVVLVRELVKLGREYQRARDGR